VFTFGMFGGEELISTYITEQPRHHGHINIPNGAHVRRVSSATLAPVGFVANLDLPQVRIYLTVRAVLPFFITTFVNPRPTPVLEIGGISAYAPTQVIGMGRLMMSPYGQSFVCAGDDHHLSARIAGNDSHSRAGFTSLVECRIARDHLDYFTRHRCIIDFEGMVGPDDEGSHSLASLHVTGSSPALAI